MCLVFLVKDREVWVWRDEEIRREESRFGRWGRRNLGLDFRKRKMGEWILSIGKKN
jgi:hypothetical protein